MEYLEDKPYARPRQGGMGGIILHYDIADLFEVIDPSSDLGKNVPYNDLFAALSLEPPYPLLTLLLCIVGQLE